VIGRDSDCEMLTDEEKQQIACLIDRPVLSSEYLRGQDVRYIDFLEREHPELLNVAKDGIPLRFDWSIGLSSTKGATGPHGTHRARRPP
jgi:hypothetical protein